ncbi:nuclear transport factor 2 family protein [Actinomycetes bacterium M1A6_2h]
MTDFEPRAPITGPVDALIARDATENILARYCAAMDARDAGRAALLLADADLYFKSRAHRRGRNDIEAFYTDLFGTSTDRTAHMISNLEVGIDDGTAFYSCLYQRVLVDDAGSPTLSGIGRYTGRLAAVGTPIRWLEHRVVTL